MYVFQQGLLTLVQEALTSSYSRSLSSFSQILSYAVYLNFNVRSKAEQNGSDKLFGHSFVVISGSVAELKYAMTHSF